MLLPQSKSSVPAVPAQTDSCPPPGPGTELKGIFRQKEDVPPLGEAKQKHQPVNTLGAALRQERRGSQRINTIPLPIEELRDKICPLPGGPQ